MVEWAELAPTSLSLPAELATDIERLILAGELPPGAKLTIYYPGGRKVYIGEEGQPE